MTVLMGNSLSAYLVTLAIFISGILIALILSRVILRSLNRWAKQTQTTLDDRLLRKIEKPITYLLLLGSFFLSIGNLKLPLILENTIRVMGVIVPTYLGVQLILSFLEFGIRLYWVRRQRNKTLEQSFNALFPAIKVMVWILGLVFILDNLGFDISAVVASLGIGGIAVALAAQGILGDLFSYFSILLDRPFEIGDFVIVGDLKGTVENIGIKTTRLRSIGGEEWVISNTDLTAARLQNFRRMARRRIAFSFGITYETQQEQIQEVPNIVQAIIESLDRVTFDRAHFESFGDFSLNYEVVYYVESNDYQVYMDIQQTINCAIKSEFEQRHIEFAYPTQLLYLSQNAAAS